MKLTLEMVPRRLATVILAGSIVAGMAASMALAAVRGPLAPAWVESVTRPDSDLVAAQFDLGLAINRWRVLPETPCWKCRLRNALAINPMSARAVRVMAMYEVSTGHNAQADRLFELSHRLTRRESIVQVWKIQQAERSGDALAEVKHLDQAISVRPQLGEQIFPQINRRLTDPQFRAAFARLMRDNHHWMDEYVQAATADPANLRILAQTLAEASPGGPVTADLAPYEKGLIAALVGAKDYTTAYSTARRLLASDSVLRDVAFNKETVDSDYSPLLWTSTESAEIAMRLTAEGVLRIDVLSGVNGIAVYRVMQLRPGRYQFGTLVSALADSTMPAHAWEAHCVAGRGEGLLGRAAAPAGGSGQAALQFTVPEPCEAVRLSFTVANEVGQDRSALELTAAHLRSTGI